MLSRIIMKILIKLSLFLLNCILQANPFYAAFNCLGSWSAESRDTPSRGDFIVMEMYDSSTWPYCGRYKVGSDGAITLSLYLSMSEDTFFPVFCDATKDNEYYYQSGATKYVRMHFTPVDPCSASASSSNSSFWEKLRDLYWPWWILVAAAVLTIMTLFICLLVFARKRKKRKVETLKKSKDAIRKLLNIIQKHRRLKQCQGIHSFLKKNQMVNSLQDRLE